jgi:hypothetical protein
MQAPSANVVAVKHDFEHRFVLYLWVFSQLNQIVKLDGCIAVIANKDKVIAGMMAQRWHVCNQVSNTRHRIGQINLFQQVATALWLLYDQIHNGRSPFRSIQLVRHGGRKILPVSILMIAASSFVNNISHHLFRVSNPPNL